MITVVECSNCGKQHSLYLSEYQSVNVTFGCLNCGTAMIVNSDLSTSRLMDRALELALDSLRKSGLS